MNSVLVDPLAPDQLHSHFSQAATRAAREIKDFGHFMEQKKSKEVLEKARDSRAKDAEGITGWIVSAYEDWLDVKNEEDSDSFEMAEDGEDTTGSTADVKSEDMQAAVEEFKESHPGIEALFDVDARTINVRSA